MSASSGVAGHAIGLCLKCSDPGYLSNPENQLRCNCQNPVFRALFEEQCNNLPPILIIDPAPDYICDQTPAPYGVCVPDPGIIVVPQVG